MSELGRRRTTAVLALAGLFLSVYLLLHRLGVYGELMCGSGSCETVQASTYSVFLGIPVVGWGVGWYLAVLGLALLAIRRAGADVADVRRPARSLALLATAGLAFSVYLTWVELEVLHAICRWCVGSAVLTVLIFLFVGPWRLLRPEFRPE